MAAVGFVPERDDTATHWWAGVGIQFRTMLGLADVSASYIENENVGDLNKFADFGVDYQSWAIGFAQNVDAIGGAFYLSYIHHEADGCIDSISSGVPGECDEGEEVSGDLDTIMAGMRLRY